LNNVSFTTQGYVQQAAVFIHNDNQMLTAPSIPLSNTSFTVETWFYSTGFLNIQDHSIFGFCYAPALYQCLHITIRQRSFMYYLYFGFYDADCPGNIPLTSNTWYHAGLVFDMTSMTQFVYLNGVLDRSCIQSSAVNAFPGNVTIGYIPGIVSNTYPDNHFQVIDFFLKVAIQQYL